MTNDLVKWLREYGNRNGEYECCEAADRIEKLETALLVIEGMLSERLPSAEKCEMAYEYVRGIEYDRTR
jgi:hypothetical protein